jgi:hypothetical protein
VWEVESTVRNGPRADQLRRQKKVPRKAKARERRLQRQMRATSWLAERATRPPLALAFQPSTGPGEPVRKRPASAYRTGCPLWTWSWRVASGVLVTDSY